MKQMTSSKLGRSLIKHFEGLRLDAYRCAAGRLTIGWGHTAGVRPGQHITVAEAERLLTADIAPIERLLNVLDLDLSQEHLNFAFNCNNYRNYYQCVDYQHLESMLPFDRQFLRAFCRYICNNYDFEVFLLNSHVFKHL